MVESAKGRGRLIGSFLEALLVANPYRGELLCLMAIHLILLSINRVHGDLLGHIKVVSDCLGALKRVTDLPPYRIPSRCKHSYIPKNILVNCWGLSFTTYYSHVKAHQDKLVSFANLSQKAQLNCICNHTVKQQIAIDGLDSSALGHMFPLEPIGIFVRGEKMTSDTREQLPFLGTPPACAIILQQPKNNISRTI